VRLPVEQATDQKPGTAPEKAAEERPAPPVPPAKKPAQKRPSRARRRRRKTRGEIVAGWLRSKFGRIGGVLFTPRKTFEEIAESPDYFGVIFILVVSILASVAAHYVLWITKMSFFDVDLRTFVSPVFPYGYYVLSEGFSFGAFYLARNFVMYYLLSWALGGERDAGLLLLCTGYSLGTQLVGRLLQAFVFYAVFPPVTYQVSTETSIMLLAGSVQQLLVHQEAWAGITAFNQDVSKAWQMSPTVRGFSYLTYAINAWTTVVAAAAIYTVTRLSWKRSGLIAGTVFALDTVFFAYSLM